ncbi:NlpC/P60 family protein [Solibacillus sp. FSL H8-0523]|uniref:C40 family peptidase n=1 Tax=Solibacillus sp. FSL H8-0523 TaxID=2954511 RepID=UPI00310146FE
MKKIMKTLASFAFGTAILFTTISGASAASHTVKSGDTLSSIARQYGTTYQAIMSNNGLMTTNIKIGQTLEVSGKKVATSAKTSASYANVVSIAKQYLGVNYRFGGSTPAGFDCSGFVTYVLNKSGKQTYRTTAAGFYNKATKVSNPKVGDLVFFSNTFKKGISHVGIYIGDGKMINASGSKVNISSIHSGYWKSKFTAYGRI